MNLLDNALENALTAEQREEQQRAEVEAAAKEQAEAAVREAEAAAKRQAEAKARRAARAQALNNQNKDDAIIHILKNNNNKDLISFQDRGDYRNEVSEEPRPIYRYRPPPGPTFG